MDAMEWRREIPKQSKESVSYGTYICIAFQKFLSSTQFQLGYIIQGMSQLLTYTKTDACLSSNVSTDLSHTISGMFVLHSD